MGPMGDGKAVPVPPCAQLAAAPDRLARRDYFILPFLSLLTVLIMFAGAETLTRMMWNAHEENSCAIPDETRNGFYRFKSNCMARTKSAESTWVTYHFNECGYRSNTSCNAVRPDTLRIAILGSSLSFGFNVPYEDTYYARSSDELTRLCRRPVDVQNLGKPKLSPIFAYRTVEDALALKPDVVLYVLAPFDLEQQIDPKALAELDDPVHPLAATAVYEPLSLMRRIQLLLTESRTLLVAEHFLLQNRDTYLRLYLNYGDKADFLRQPFTPAWQRRFIDMDRIIGGMADKLKAAGVPFVVIPVPSRAEAALLSAAQGPPGVDPFAFGRRLEEIANTHGASYLDLMEPFSKIRNSENLFLIVDGHVAAGGQQVIATRLTRKLIDGSIPAFAACGSAMTQARR